MTYCLTLIVGCLEKVFYLVLFEICSLTSAQWVPAISRLLSASFHVSEQSFHYTGVKEEGLGDSKCIPQLESSLSAHCTISSLY